MDMEKYNSTVGLVQILNGFTFWADEKGWLKNAMHLDGYQHLLLGRAEVVALSQEDFAESPFSQLPLQNNVPPFHMLDI